jgi:hypothetical protein
MACPPETGSQISFQAYNDQHHQHHFFTLDSSPATNDYVVYDSPSAVSISSNWNPISPQSSYLSDPLSHYSSPDNKSSYGGVVDYELSHVLKEFEHTLLHDEDGGGDGDDDGDDGSIYSSNNEYPRTTAAASFNYNQMLQMVPRLDLKQLLLLCAEAFSYDDISTVERLLDVLGRMVSVTGDPSHRLGAYILEGLRAKLVSSGSRIYNMLKCKEPTSSELLSYMHVLYQICPYYKFAYMSANVVIKETMENESIIHIIDFQIAQGSQWMSLIQELARRPGGPPRVRITGVDDANSAHARGGGLDLVGQKLTEFAKSQGVQFEFHAAAVPGCEVEREDLAVVQGEALAVNFPYMLHHMPDESVNTRNSRDRLLRLVKSLSPKVVTLLEQESNTNTTLFYHRFCEMLDYYTAMFESIDAGRGRDDKQRINAEAHCVARDIVNIIACEGEERVERHELFGKWRSRLTMAGFTQCRLSMYVGSVVKDMLLKEEYSRSYWVGERSGALFLGWKNRDLVTCSAWR